MFARLRMLDVVLRFRFMVMIEVLNGWVTLTNPCSKQKHLFKMGPEMRDLWTRFHCVTPSKKKKLKL